MTRGSYWSWTWAFRLHLPLCLTLQTIPRLTISQRKDLLSLSRVQSPILPGSRVHQSLTHLRDDIPVPADICKHEKDVRWLVIPFSSYLDTYSTVYLDLIPASIIALAVRIAPGVTEEDFKRTLDQSVQKEITAAINRFSGALLDFRPIFSSDLSARELPFCDRMAPNPEVASNTYQLFCRIRFNISDMLVFPSLGKKTVGQQVATHFWSEYYRSGCTFKHLGDGSTFDTHFVTPSDCLRIYEETGGMISGPVEMRSAWTYNQLAPRVYYARGGDVIPVSQYLQPIINTIIDAFPETHRLNRFAPPPEPLDDHDVEVIYDYAAFTSTLDSVVEFVDKLADFFEGTTVRLVDVRDGIVDTDLGWLFREYNRQCNEYIEFDISRVCPSADYCYLAHTCGMLGVEGNIFMATLLHGLYLRFISGLGRSRCVGDDARLHFSTVGRMTNDDKDWLSWMLQGIGDMNPEKMAYFEKDVDPLMQAYRYIKRPLSRDLDIMIEGVMLMIPSLFPIMAPFDDFHAYHPASVHPCKVTFKSIIRLLSTLKAHHIVDDGGIDFSALVAHIRFLQARIIEQDPKGDFAPIARSGTVSRYHLPPVELWGQVEYQDWLIGDLGYDEVVRFMKLGGGDFENCDGRCGSEMVKASSQGRSFLVKMGYLQETMLFDDVSLEMVGEGMMRTYLEGKYHSVKHYYVLRDIPCWYAALPDVL